MLARPIVQTNMFGDPALGAFQTGFITVGQRLSALLHP
jgi:hypothetical protein